MTFNEWWIEYDTKFRIAGFNSKYGAAVGCAKAAWNAAIASVKQPPNTQMQSDKTPKCSVCDWGKENKIYDKYCGCCGRAFDR